MFRVVSTPQTGGSAPSPRIGDRCGRTAAMPPSAPTPRHGPVQASRRMKIVSSTRLVERDAVLAGCRGRMQRDARTVRANAADPSQERSRPILDDAYQDLSSKADRRAQALGPCAGTQRCCGVDARLRRSMPGTANLTKTTSTRAPKLCLSATLAMLTGVGMVPNIDVPWQGH